MVYTVRCSRSNFDWIQLNFIKLNCHQLNFIQFNFIQLMVLGANCINCTMWLIQSDFRLLNPVLPVLIQVIQWFFVFKRYYNIKGCWTSSHFLAIFRHFQAARLKRQSFLDSNIIHIFVLVQLLKFQDFGYIPWLSLHFQVLFLFRY